MARLPDDDRTADGRTDDGRPRCGWATGPWLAPYHDEEWGVPVHDDRRHFELLVLEGAQAGLSWLTVLKRRDGYRKAFADFDPAKVARFTEKKAESLMGDPGIIRHRQKIQATIGNAGHFLAVQEELGSFDDYLWGFVDGQPVVNRWPAIGHVPATSALSDTVSADLRRRGFRFVGSTICYAYLQAAGIVNDHLTTCFRYDELTG
ncbi:MAG TPA: DNA-3-methyladenine glycosylase I [Acidimicrobiales bacterium]|jgi:DNA-3-methyladenine glycosylase I